MANEEHLAILKQGMTAWNKWRREHLEIRLDLSGADLSGADLREADLSGAILRQAILRQADLWRAILWRTVFGNVDLSQVKGLETVKHRGPSTIGIDTIYRSGGKIPEVFLKGAGVPDEFITFMHSLVASQGVIQFYSCFISYSSKNQDFANRLYADLQARNVRCWFAPEDLKIGDKFLDTIHEAIRVHDKLLVILSGTSIASDWVEDEVSKALEQERRQKRLVLFPITIDDAIWDSSKGWAENLRTVRHIGDFRHWKDHDGYQHALTRLLRDLKAGA